MRRAILLVTSAILISGSVQAQNSNSPEWRAAVAAVRANPADADASFHLARLASEAGDFQTAIAALERILLIYPNLDNIRLELGVLYLRTGNVALAEPLIREAVQSPDSPPAVRQQALEYLEAAKVGNRRLHFAGNIAAGLIADSNANSGPASGTTFAGATVTPGSTGVSDVSAFAAFGGRARYDIGAQAGHLLAFDLDLYHRRYSDRSELDITTLSGAVGMDMNLAPALGRPADLVLRYQVSGQWRAGEHSLTEHGPIVSYRSAVGKAGRFNASVFWFQQEFEATTALSSNDDRDGERWGVQVGYSHALSERTQATVTLGYADKSAAAGYEAFEEVALDLGLSHLIDARVGTRGPWRLGLNASVSQRDYDAPTLASLTEAQSDTRYGLSASVSVPVTDTAAVIAEIGQVWNQSNYSIADYDNTYISVSFTKNF